MSFTPSAAAPKCPACGFTVFNRRYPNCEGCGRALPATLVLSAAELAALQEKEGIEERLRQLERNRQRYDTGPGDYLGDIGASLGGDACGGDAGCGGDGGDC